MIFSNFPESSPFTVNTGYLDEILACSMFDCWSNISMRNHWRCPPSNPIFRKSNKGERSECVHSKFLTFSLSSFDGIWRIFESFPFIEMRKLSFGSCLPKMVLFTEISFVIEVKIPKAYKSTNEGSDPCEWLKIWYLRSTKKKLKCFRQAPNSRGNFSLHQMFDQTFWMNFCLKFSIIHVPRDFKMNRLYSHSIYREPKTFFFPFPHPFLPRL